MAEKRDPSTMSPKGKEMMNPKEKRNENNVEKNKSHQSIDEWFKDPTPYKKDDIVTTDDPWGQRNERRGADKKTGDK
jgi:hypothetical protein